jgi:hypothetical protein
VLIGGTQRSKKAVSVRASAIRAVAAIAAAGALAFVTASPAYAAAPALPDGDTFYAIGCPYYTDVTVPMKNNQLLLVDPETALSETRGAGSAGGNGTTRDNNCAAQAAWDPTTETAYFVSWTDTYTSPVLAIMDRASGSTTVVGEFTLGGVRNVDIVAIAIGADGAAYAIDDEGYSLFSLNLDTGALTSINDDVRFTQDPAGFAVNPKTGDFYVMDYVGRVYKIDVSDGTLTDLGVVPGIDIDEMYGFTIDANGVAWMGNDVDYLDEYGAELWSIDLASFGTTAVLSGVTATSAGVVYTQSWFIAPFVAAPAAPVLPDGDTFYAIGCPYYTDVTVPTKNNQLLLVDPETAFSATRGAGSAGGNATTDSNNCAAQAAWDPKTETAYFVSWTDTYTSPVLAIMDRASGSTTVVGEFTLGGVRNVDIVAIAIGADGAAYAIDDGGYSLFSLNLDTGALTSINDDVDLDGDPTGFAVNPKTGDFYVMDEYGFIYKIDVSDGTLTDLGVVPGIDIDMMLGFSIDSNGVAWMGNDTDYLDGYGAEMWSIDLASFDTDAVYSGVITTSAGVVFTQSWFIAPFAAVASGLELADTGPNSWTTVGAASGLLAVLLGSVFMVVRSRRRTA